MLIVLLHRRADRILLLDLSNTCTGSATWVYCSSPRIACFAFCSKLFEILEIDSVQRAFFCGMKENFGDRALANLASPISVQSFFPSVGT